MNSTMLRNPAVFSVVNLHISIVGMSSHPRRQQVDGPNQFLNNSKVCFKNVIKNWLFLSNVKEFEVYSYSCRRHSSRWIQREKSLITSLRRRRRFLQVSVTDPVIHPHQAARAQRIGGQCTVLVFPSANVWWGGFFLFKSAWPSRSTFERIGSLS